MKRFEDLEPIDDYVKGIGSDAEVASFEEALFTRALAGQARDLAVYDWLTGTFRQLGDRGTFMSFISSKDAASVRARYGDRVHFLEVPLGTERQTLTVPPSAELVVARTPVDLRNVDRVDVEASVEGFGVVKTMPDVAFDREDGAIFTCCESELFRQMIGMPILSRYWGHGAEGRRLLGQIVAIAVLG